MGEPREDFPKEIHATVQITVDNQLRRRQAQAQAQVVDDDRRQNPQPQEGAAEPEEDHPFLQGVPLHFRALIFLSILMLYFGIFKGLLLVFKKTIHKFSPEESDGDLN